MKKCPYCAEEIRDEAVICRYCGREYRHVAIKTNPLLERKVELLNRDDNKYIFNLDDTKALYDLWLVGYKPNDGIKEMVQLLFARIKNYNDAVGPAIDLLYKHRFINQEQLNNYANETIALYLRWSTLCFGIGVDTKYYPFEADNVPFYLFAFSHPFMLVHSAMLNNVYSKGKEKIEKLKKLSENISKCYTTMGINFASLGAVNACNFQPIYKSGERSEFLDTLIQLDIVNRVKRVRHSI